MGGHANLLCLVPILTAGGRGHALAGGRSAQSFSSLLLLVLSSLSLYIYLYFVISYCSFLPYLFEGHANLLCIVPILTGLPRIPVRIHTIKSSWSISAEIHKSVSSGLLRTPPNSLSA